MGFSPGVRIGSLEVIAQIGAGRLPRRWLHPTVAYMSQSSRRAVTLMPDPTQQGHDMGATPSVDAFEV